MTASLLDPFVKGRDALLIPHFAPFLKHKDDKIYPLLLGGISLVRCVDKPQTVQTQDIDIKFVTTDHALVDEAVGMRTIFLDNILADQKIRKAFPTLQKSEVDTTLITLRQTLFIIDSASGKRHVIIDTGIASSKTFPIFHHYQNLFTLKSNSSTHHPIPYYVYNQLPFATCNWTYYDTVRMLNSTKQDWDKHPTSRFHFEKYQKYIGKFIHMYSFINKKALDINVPTAPTPMQMVKVETELYNKTNLLRLVKKIVPSPELNVIAQNVLRYLLKNTLGKYMKKYKTRDYYPVVNGGANIPRCTKNRNSIPIKDIDLPFIINNDDVMSKVVKARADFVNDILTDAPLLTLLSRISKDTNMNITIRLNDLITTVKDGEYKSLIEKMRLQKIALDFADKDNNLILSMDLVDSILLHKGNASNGEWHTYDRYINTDLHDAIPYVTDQHGVMYVTCGYLFFDTLKLITIYQAEYKKTHNPWHFKQYVKYLGKFALLQPVNTNAMYEKAKRLVNGFDLWDQTSMLQVPRYKQQQLARLLKYMQKETSTVNFKSVLKHVTDLTMAN